jgi:hypothetical protein
MRFPIRHSNLSLENDSVVFFRNCLPRDWNVTNPSSSDYGIDVSIEISENGQYKGLELIVQLKSSVSSNNREDNERQRFSVRTYNYLKNNLRVALIVKYIAEENEAYWILLKDVPPPNENSETFTIYIPRSNKLSTINWQENIVEHVKHVSQRKLNAR